MLSDLEKVQVKLLNKAVQAGEMDREAADAFIGGSVTAIIKHLIDMTDAGEVKCIVDLLTEKYNK